MPLQALAGSEGFAAVPATKAVLLLRVPDWSRRSRRQPVAESGIGPEQSPAERDTCRVTVAGQPSVAQAREWDDMTRWIPPPPQPLTLQKSGF